MSSSIVVIAAIVAVSLLSILRTWMWALIIRDVLAQHKRETDALRADAHFARQQLFNAQHGEPQEPTHD